MRHAFAPLSWSLTLLSQVNKYNQGWGDGEGLSCKRENLSLVLENPRLKKKRSVVELSVEEETGRSLGLTGQPTQLAWHVPGQ